MANKNTAILASFHQRPVAFNVLLAQVADSAVAGLFLSQLNYWSGKGRNKTWTYKTYEEFRRELHLTRSELDRSIRIWKELGVLEVRVARVPPVRHFKINLMRLYEVMGERLESPELRELANQYVEKLKSTNPIQQNTTESIPEKTTKIRIFNPHEDASRSFFDALVDIEGKMRFPS